MKSAYAETLIQVGIGVKRHIKDGKTLEEVSTLSLLPTSYCQLALDFSTIVAEKPAIGFAAIMENWEYEQVYEEIKNFDWLTWKKKDLEKKKKES
jgi:hypothetical protein